MAILWVLTASSAVLGAFLIPIAIVIDDIEAAKVAVNLALAFAIIPFIITMSIKEFKNNGKD